MGSKPKVAIVSPTGLIGSAIYDLFKDQYDLGLIYRNEDRLSLLFERFGEAENYNKHQIEFNDLYQEYLKTFYGQKYGRQMGELVSFLKNYDWVINASGIIKPFCDNIPDLAFFVNSALPNILAQEFGSKLMQITTDCVFNGSHGAPYNETAPKSPPDLYGLSKALGEPREAIVLRCSTIGYELSGNRGLLELLVSIY